LLTYQKKKKKEKEIVSSFASFQLYCMQACAVHEGFGLNEKPLRYAEIVTLPMTWL
jgi:hypothetical protein